MLKPFNNQPQLISEPKVKPHCWRPYNSNNLYFGIKKTVTDKSTIFLVREKKKFKAVNRHFFVRNYRGKGTLP